MAYNLPLEDREGIWAGHGEMHGKMKQRPGRQFEVSLTNEENTNLPCLGARSASQLVNN